MAWGQINRQASGLERVTILSTWIGSDEHRINSESIVLLELDLSNVLLFDCSRGYSNISRLVQ